MKHIICLPNGQQLSSGSVGNAILSAKLTQCVNSRQELTLGSACAAMLEMKLLLEEALDLEAGQEFVLYREDDLGNREKMGIFVAQEPVRTGPAGYSLTAFDRMVYTDRDLSGWLNALTGWPYTLQQLAQQVCLQCGLEMTGEAFPNADLPVQAFTATDITGRELLQWIGEAAGRFCRIDPDGRLEFAWYTPAGRLSLGPESGSLLESDYYQGDLTLELTGTATQTGVMLEGPYLSATWEDGAVTLTGPEQQYYFMGGLQHADYTVAPIEKVQIRSSAQDIGTVYPNEGDKTNAYIIEGNPLLTAQSGESLLQLAQDLYEQLSGLCYTPCKVSLPASAQLQPGQCVQITDSLGNSMQMLIMQKTGTGQKDVLECTGSRHRSTTTAVNSRYLKALSGKVLELRTDVDGLQVKNADAQGRVAQLSLDLEGLRSRISRQEDGLTQVSRLEQDAKELKLQLQTLEEGSNRVITSTGYSFTDEGLRISRQGQQMESLVDHTGLYVNRGGTPILQAGHRGVTAVDVKVGNYLEIGAHARFEDYEGGTACFYI